MNDQITLKDDYIHVELSGEYTLEAFRRNLEKMLDLAMEKGYDKVLVDGRQQTELPGTLDTFLGAEELAARIRRLRIATVMPADLVNPQHRFFETVAVNRGAQIATFLDEESALNWLLGADPPRQS